MKCLLILLAVVLAGCANAPTPDPRIQAAAMNESDRLNAIVATQERQSQNATFEYEQTSTALPFSVTALAQERALTQIYVDGKAADAVATQTYRATESAYSAIIIPTKIAAVGTELALGAERQRADVAAAQSRRDMWAGAPLAMLVTGVMLAWWVSGLIKAHHKKQNKIAEAEPFQVGEMMCLPNGSGGWTLEKVIQGSHTPALAAPVEIENRDVPVNGGKSFVSVSYPVNDHEREWRTALVQAVMVFKAQGTASPDLCGKGKPFASASHWKDITDRLADNGLVLKDNGGPTLPVGGWGEIIARLQDANKPLRLPASRPPRLRAFSLENSV